MTDYADLVKRLRDGFRTAGIYELKEAADAIKALEEKLDRLGYSATDVELIMAERLAATRAVARRYRDGYEPWKGGSGWWWALNMSESDPMTDAERAVIDDLDKET